MKPILLFTLVLFLFSLQAVAQGRKCVGSSPCSACTTCSGCKYCNAGGTCGVCSSNHNSGNSYKTSPKKSGANQIPAQEPASEQSGVIGATYNVAASTLNLRSGPATSSSVLQTLKQGDILILIALDGLWCKVLVQSTDKIGYVYADYITKK